MIDETIRKQQQWKPKQILTIDAIVPSLIEVILLLDDHIRVALDDERESGVLEQ